MPDNNTPVKGNQYVLMDGHKVPVERLMNVLISENKKLDRRVKQLQSQNKVLRNKQPKAPRLVQEERQYAAVSANVRILLKPDAMPQTVVNTVYEVLQTLNALNQAASVQIDMNAEEAHTPPSEDELREMAGRYVPDSVVQMTPSAAGRPGASKAKRPRDYTEGELRQLAGGYIAQAEGKGRK